MNGLYSPRNAEPSGFNGASLLRIWIIALILVPENLVLKPLGAAGSPAQVLGLFAGAWWLGAQLGRIGSPVPSRRSHTLYAMLVFTALILLCYIVAATRPIDDLELSAADRGLLQTASWLGIFMLVSMEIVERSSLNRALRLLVNLVGIAAVLGVIQFTTGTSFVDSISLPGLSPNQVLTSVYDRNGFARSAGTSIHPIEFGVMLTMTLPLALHFAVTDTTRTRFVRWAPVAAISVAIPVSISRSALIGVIVVLAIVLPGWPPHRRRVTYAVILALLAAVYVAVPGLLGTLIGLFTGVGSDASALSRTNSYELAFTFFERAPVLGRGFFTFLPEYRILDNQYLGILIEMGIVGLAAFLALLLTGAFEASRLAVIQANHRTRSLGRALMAAIVSAACAFATFDALSFNQVASLTFMVLGCIAMLTRTQSERDDFSINFGSAPGFAPRQSVQSARSEASSGYRRGAGLRKYIPDRHDRMAPTERSGERRRRGPKLDRDE